MTTVRAIGAGLLLWISLASSTPCGAAEDSVALTPLPGSETGLKAAMEQWKAAELARQGGKFGSHGWWPWGLAAFDCDNDGDLDLLAQQHGAPRSMILRNLLKEKGKVAFVNANPELGLPSNALAGCFKPLVWDFDGDGFLDLAYRDSQPETFFLNRQGKGFEALRPGLGEIRGMRPPEDVDDIGLPCLCTPSARYHFQSAERKFTREPWQPRWHAQPPAAIATLVAEAGKTNRFFRSEFFEGIELGGKGRKDLAWGGFGPYGGQCLGRYLIADKDGGFADATERLGLPTNGTPVYFADLNGDGVDDVLVAHGDRAGLYLSDGKGAFALKPGPLTDFLRWKDPYLHKVYPVDLDNDGVLDLVLNSPRLGGVEAHQNLGRGELRRVLKAGGWDADPVAVCDINDDGLMDVCVGGPKEDITIYLNRCPRPGNACDLYPRMGKPNPYAVGARVQVFRAGDLGRQGAVPLLDEKAHSDGTPIHIGLGAERAFDLCVTFPGKTPKRIERQRAEARRKLQVTPDGGFEEIR